MEPLEPHTDRELWEFIVALDESGLGTEWEIQFMSQLEEFSDEDRRRLESMYERYGHRI